MDEQDKTYRFNVRNCGQIVWRACGGQAYGMTRGVILSPEPYTNQIYYKITKTIARCQRIA